MATSVATTPPIVSQDLLNSVNGNKKSRAAEGSVEADQDKFMTLLVTQLKNQDPMNPLDNAQITSQLAQLSTVTGINKLNTSLEALKGSYQSSEALQAANMIGRGVLLEGNRVRLADGKAILGVELASSADNVQVIITDPRTGKDVHTINMGPQAAGTVPLAWDGVTDSAKLDADGKPIPLPSGNYLFRVVADRGGQPLTDVRSLSFDSVLSVSTSARDGVKLNLASGGSAVTMADLKQIL